MVTTALSVCIPARNEANTIASTVNSALNQNFSGELEVLVCANICTDNTENIVETLAERHKNVRLLRSEPGKPNAWNKLVDEASYDTLVFLDGDIIVKQGSFNAFQEVYNSNPEIYGVSSGGIKVLEDFNIISRAFNYPIDVPPGDGFNGRLNTIKREDFIRLMNDKGYYEMPQDLINEDRWVSLILEERENYRVIRKFWVGTNKAKAYFKPAKIQDFLVEQIRLKQGAYQLQFDHPDLHYRAIESSCFIKKFPGWFARWKQIENPVEKIVVPFSFLTRRMMYNLLDSYADYKARQTYSNGEATNLWTPTLSSKTGFTRTISDN